MQPLNPQPRDPAPSRAAYRLHRLWLTPHFRFLTRVGLPVLAAAGLVVWAMSQPGYRAAMAEKLSDLRRSIEERPEFMVKLMAIDGASAEVAEAIRVVVPVDLPVSSFDLDIKGMQERIGQLDAVRRVDVRIRPGGILQIDVRERTPVAVWRLGRDLMLVDARGRRVAPLGARGDRPDLPLVAGEGAGDHVPEALAVLDAAAPIAGRVRGIVRVGERRWDLVLDRDQRILLPEDDPVAAMQQVIALQEATGLLDRDIERVDLRLVGRPTVRLSEPALADLIKFQDW